MTGSTATLHRNERRHGRGRTVLRRLVRGRTDATTWERPALLGLLVATAVLYLWDLAASGWANSFYSAAVQAGSVNWEAFFYGSSDAANSITVDKPPASLWLMALSVRLFGLSSFSILLPEAIMGVVTVALVYAIVRRHFSPGTALLAGGALAITPVAALMFRFNNPDALLVLLMTLSVYFTLRGIESGRIRWLMWAGAMVGFGFLTKQLQAFLILPVLVGAYLWMSPRRWGTRFLHLLAALGTLVLSAGWWVAVVELVPASKRPYIGGSQNNSFLELTFGYNGLGRLSGNETGSVGGTGGNAGGNWGSTGLLRLFEGEIGGQITWLLPAALIVMIVAFVLLWHSPRTDPRRAVLVLFAGWLLVTALAFSFMAGIFHAYYTVALAPPLAGTVAIGASLLWSRRDELWARIVAATTVVLTAMWVYSLLSEAADWLPWLKWVVLVLGLAAAVLLMLPRRGRVLAAATLAVTLVSALVAPAAYSLETVTTAHTGSIVTAGPTVSGSMGAGTGGGGFGGGGFGDGGQPGGGAQGGTQTGGTAPGGTTGTGSATGQPPTGTAQGGRAGTAGETAGGMGGMSGLLGSGTVSSAVVAKLTANASDYTWVAAAVGSNNAAGYQLASGDPVMAIGGFNGSDPSPTLAEFKADVAAGKIHYFVAGGSLGQSSGGSSASSSIAAWVEKNFTATTVDGTTLYDLNP
ncbi:MAG TPA: glycosyltransferase family 39 protein [Lacisediminihabitans sp.]|uniref:ArnT family glycosyltransferase n=1 Tax=Lacisediminihabitans sp. TaxID=2787631 RepID=UPI002EDA6296